MNVSTEWTKLRKLLMRHYSKLDSKPTVFTIQIYARRTCTCTTRYSGTYRVQHILREPKGMVAFPCDFLIDVPPWNWPSMGNRGYRLRQPAKVFLPPQHVSGLLHFHNCGGETERSKKVTGQLGQWSSISSLFSRYRKWTVWNIVSRDNGRQ